MRANWNGYRPDRRTPRASLKLVKDTYRPRPSTNTTTKEETK